MEFLRRDNNSRIKACSNWRAGLCASTALSAALVSPLPARAQTISPTATPQGGVVVAGSATIIQATGSTTIDQSSQRAAINFQSFNVGSAASVQINQPNANSVELDRVVGGNLSQINGRINSNGQVVLINQSGVVFGKGAQVNAENVVVSTSNIATADFMNGHMVFSGAPNPGAQIINNGHITARQAGLVGLVAPQVENNGVITATLGQVVLAGASAFTLDLYGDRLITLDVTKAVQAVDVGGKLVPALVTNTGLILADGGKVTLTAQDAGALVTQLINAGGTIRANSVGADTGAISIEGVGGNISIAGNLLAQGQGGTHGGNIQALTTGTVSVAPSAVVDASGDSGGGLIAIGTDITRAKAGAANISAPKAASVVIAQGATLAADATGLGNAGTVTLLSSQNTAFDGAISLQGGPRGGNGGTAEISSDGVISLGGSVLATAANGKAGDILLDPQTLVVSGAATTATISGSGPTIIGGFDTTVTSVILNTDLNSLTGTVILEAASLISVAAPVNSTSIAALSMVSQGDISVAASIDIGGAIDLAAAGSLYVGAGLTASSVALTSGIAGTDINADVTAARGTVMLGSTGTIFEDTNGFIVTTNLSSNGTIGGDALLTGNNTITTLGDFTAGGNLILTNTGGLTAAGPVSAGNISLSGASLTFEGDVAAKGLLALTSTGTVSQGAGNISAGTLTGSADGLFALDHSGNSIGTLGAVSAIGGNFSLVDTTALTVADNVSANDIHVSAPTLALDATLSATNGAAATLAVAANNISVSGGSFSVSHGTLDIAPLTVGGVDINGSAANALDLSASVLRAFDTSATVIEIGNGVIGRQAQAIAIDGSVSFASGSLVHLSTSGTISDNSGTLSAGTLEFDAAGFVQAPSSAWDVTKLQGAGTAISGPVSLAGLANQIGTLANLAAGSTLDVLDSGTLAVAGLVSATVVTLAAPELAVAAGATLRATGGSPLLVLNSDTLSAGTGASLQAPGGTIALAPFMAGDAIDLGGAGSSGTLGIGADVIAALDPAASLLVVGNESAGNITINAGGFSVSSMIDLSTGGGIFDFGSLNAGTIEFDAGAGFSEAAAAAIKTALFGGDGGPMSGNVLLAGTANAIGALGSFGGALGTLSVLDTGALTIAGVIDPASVTLVANTLVIGNDISVASLLALGSSGVVTQTAGSITAPSLVSYGSIGGDVSLADAGNAIGTLGGFTLGGVLRLVDSGLLTVTGPVAGNAVSLLADTIDLAGNITTPDQLALGSTGSITQSAGSISAGTLISEGSIGGDVILTDANSIANLAAFTPGGTLDLANTGLLDVTGPVSGPVISLASGTIDLAGNITAGSVLALDAYTAGITQTAGAILAPTLTSAGQTITGTTSLSDAANQIGTLGGFASTGDVTLANGIDLTLAGPFTAANASLSAPGITISGLADLSGTLIAAGAAGVSETPNGEIIAQLFSTGKNLIAGTIDLNTAGNSIAALGTIDAAGGLTLNNNVALTFTAPVSLGGTLALLDPASITQAAGTITAAALTSDHATIGGNVSLDQPGNDIPVLGDFSTAGNLSLNDATALDLAGNIHAAAISLISTGALSETGIITTPVLNANAVSINLPGANTIGTLGSITTGTLSINGVNGIAGPVSASTATLISDSAFSITGNASITNLLTIFAAGGISQTGGDVTAGTAILTTAENFVQNSGTINAPDMTITGANETFAGDIFAPTQLAFGSTGTIIQTAGGITAGTLTSAGSIGGDVILTAANTIANLAAFTLGGTLDLADTGLLKVTGPVSGPLVSLASDTIDLAGNITAPTELAFGSTGSITQSAGSISAGTLISEGSIGGDVILTDANSIANLAAFTLGGTLNLANTGLLDVTGPVSGPVISLSAAGIAFDGNLNAPNELALGGAGDIIQNSGRIDTGSLVSIGTIAGNVALGLGGSATIAAIGNLSLTSEFHLDNDTSAQITGLISTPGDVVFESGGVTETGAGAIDAGQIATSGIGVSGDMLLTGNNAIGSIATSGVVSSGNFALNNTVALSVNGSVNAADVTIVAPTIELNAALDANAAGGTLAVAADAINIDNGQFLSNDGTIALAPETPGYGIDIGGTMADALDITGPLAGAFPTGTADVMIGNGPVGHQASAIAIDNSISFGGTTIVDLSTTGLMSQNSGTLNAATLEFDSAGFRQSHGAAIDAATLQGDGGTIGGSVLLIGTNNLIGELTAMSLSSGTLAVQDNAALTVAGTVSAQLVSLSAFPSLSLSGLLDAPTELALGSGGNITETGSITTGTLVSEGTIGGDAALTGKNNIDTLGAFTLGGVLDLANNGALIVSGPVSGGAISLVAGGIDVTGNATAVDTLALGVNGTGTGTITQSGGSIVAGGITSLGTIAAVTLGSSTNRIGTLAGFASAGDLVLDNATSLVIAGSVTTPGQFILQDASGVSQASGGIIDAATFGSGAGSIGGDLILGGANSIATLGNLTLASGTSLSLGDASALTIAGTVVAPSASISAQSITVPGEVTSTVALSLNAGTSIIISGLLNAGTLAMTSGGNVAETGAGLIDAGTLGTGAGSIGGNVILTDANSIANLAALTLGGTLDLINTGLLTVNGPVSGPVISLASDTIDLAGNITAPTELAFGSTGTITQSAGRLSTGTLISEGSIGGDVILTDANSIANLAAFTLGGTLNLANTGLLTVTGPVSGPAISLASDTIDLAGNITTPDQLAFGSTGTIIQTAGGISAGTLISEGSIGGNVILTAANTIANLAAFTLGGTLDLANTGLLKVTGPVSGPLVSLASDTIDLAGNITAPTELALGSTGSITQSAGSISAGTLISEGSIGGDVILTDANSIANLAAFTLGGTLDLANTGLLDVTGPVSGPVISLASGTIDLAGNITAGSVLALDAYTAGITQTAGAILAPTLTSAGQTITGTTSLSDAANQIGTLGGFASTGDVTLANGIDLTLAGPFTAANASLSAPGITISGLADLSGTLIAAGAAGVSETPNGEIIAQLFSTGKNLIAGTIDLNTAGNSIAALGTIDAAGGLTLNNNVALTFTAPVSLGGTLALLDPASITQAAGTITAAALTSDHATIGGNVSLDQPGNDIPVLGDFSTAGNLSLNDATALDLAGNIHAAAISLISTGALSETGIITTPVLNANAVSINLPGANTIGTLGSITTGTLSINGVNGIAGPVSASTATLISDSAFSITGNASITNLLTIFAAGGISQTGGDVTAGTAILTTAENFVQNSGTINAPDMTITGANETFAGDIFAPTQLAFGSTGTIIQTAGGITAGTLTSAGSIGGDVILTAANTIANLAAFTLGGTLDLADTGLLKVTGPVSGPLVSLASDTIDLAGNITAGSILALEAYDGGIDQIAGAISAPTLTSANQTIAGSTNLTQPDNNIGTIGGFNSTGNVTIADGVSLTLAGPLRANNATLTAPDVTVAGLADSTGTLILAGAGGVSETSTGQILAALFSTGAESLTGNIDLNTPGNSIAALGTIASAGGFTLNNDMALSLTAPVSLGGTLALLDLSNITQIGGSLTAAALTSDNGTIGGNVSLNQPGNDIPTLGNFAASGDVSLNDNTALDLAGDLTAAAVSLISTGALSQTGILSTPVLNADATSIILSDANTIGTLGTLSTGVLEVNGVNGISGPVTASTATLISDSAFSITGNASVTNQLTISAADAINQSGGDITANIATFTTPGDFIQHGATIASQNATLAGNNFILSGTTNIADTLQINATGSIVHDAGLLTAATFTGSAPQLASFAADTDFATLGSFIMQDSFFALANSGPLVIIGPVVASSVDISAAGKVTLQGTPNGGLFIKGSIAPGKQPSPRLGDSSITSTPGVGSPAAIIQTGNFQINSGSPASFYTGTQSQPATIFFTTSPSGTISFAPYPDQLDAPSVDIVVSSGPNGSIAGNINVKHLEIQTAHSVNLTGSINGVAGSAAAVNGSVYPVPQPQFQFNTCPIGSVNCTILPIDALPAANPLDNFDVKTRKRKKLDHNVQLPGVATRDF